MLLSASFNSAFAAEFLRKQTGTTTFTGSTTTVPIPIQLVDRSKSFLVFSSTIDNNATTNFQIGGEITDVNTLTFARTGNTGTVSISWQIFEFESGVYVQHGSSTGVSRGAPVNVAINCFDLTKSFVLISARKSGGQLGADDGVSANLTTSTNMQLMISSNGPGGADMEEAYWQIIEYQGAIVKKLTTTLSAGSATTTSTITPAISTLSKAFVVSNHWLDGDVNSDDLPRTELTNTTTVTYTRVGTTANMNFVTYVVEFTDQSTVVRGTQNFTLGTLLQDVAITAATSSGVIASGNYGRQGSTSFATDDNTGHNWFTYEITSPTNLRIQRAVGTGSTANAPWQIVTFEDTGLQQSTFYSRLAGPTAWESNTAWSFTPDGSSGAVPTGVYPRRTDNVVIQNGHTIAINAVTDNSPCSQSPDGLGLGNVGPFVGSGDQMFYHTGDIIISGGGTLTTSEEVMLQGYTLIEDGGTLTATEDIVNLGYMEVSTSGTLSSTTDDLILSGNSYTIINSTASTNDDIYIDHTDAQLCGEGVVQVGSGGAPPDPDINWNNPGTPRLDQICNGYTVTCLNNCPPGFPMMGTGNFAYGILGPGGVGSTSSSGDVRLWLDANTINQADATNITSWTDQSGYGNNATAPGGNEPVFNTNQLNGFPAVQFVNANSDYLAVPDDASLDVPTVSLFAVGNLLTTSTNQAAFIGKIDTWAPSQGYFLGKRGGNQDVQFVINTTATRSFGPITYGTDLIMAGVYDQVNVELFLNESSAGQDASAAAIIASGNDLLIGASGEPVTRFLDGDIAEAVVIGRDVNAAERIIIDNYLSSKYNLALGANDVYTMDNGGNGNYDFEVAGIGQAADGTNHRDAKGTGIVRMWNPNALGNNDFLIWGHDNGGFTASADVDGVVIEERYTRVWRVSETADVGTVSISFDFNGIGTPLGSNLRLLIDRDNDFTTNDVTPIAGTVSGNIARFSGVNFQDGDRFTLGNTDASTPLPVELLEFDAKPLSEVVAINWTTASELNNDYFMVQRSVDAEVWDDIAKVKGAGTANEKNSYQTYDTQPYMGESYYRLKQVDFDAQVSYSPIERVNFTGISRLVIHPNPSSGLFHLAGASEIAQVRIHNAIGQVVVPNLERRGGELIVDLQSFPQGVYIVQVSDGQSLQSLRMVKR